MRVQLTPCLHSACSTKSGDLRRHHPRPAVSPRCKQPTAAITSRTRGSVCMCCTSCHGSCARERVYVHAHGGHTRRRTYLMTIGVYWRGTCDPLESAQLCLHLHCDLRQTTRQQRRVSICSSRMAQQTQAPKPVPCSLETYLVEIDTTSGKRLTEASLAKHESAGRVD